VLRDDGQQDAEQLQGMCGRRFSHEEASGEFFTSAY